jgi:hypothetical protein
MFRWVCAGVALLLIWPVDVVEAQAARSRFGIADNSFLVEEAFNQEAGIFQNIFVLTRSRDRRWDGSLTQEWPVGGQRHQASFTVPFSVVAGSGALGDVQANYRLQVWQEGGRLPAFSPRVSAIFATSAERRSLGAAGTGWQVNLPFSKQVGAVYVHANAGATWTREPTEPANGTRAEWTSATHVAASAIWGLRPMFHPMLEVFFQSGSLPAGGRESFVIVAPGFRTGWNVGDRQWVAGVGVPMTRGDARDEALLVYVSFELPFSRR